MMRGRASECVRLSVLVACLLALNSGACSRTWEGMKEDTR